MLLLFLPVYQKSLSYFNAISFLWDFCDIKRGIPRRRIFRHSAIPPGHFALEFFASQIERSEMECSALGFSHVRWKPRNWQLAKMRSFHQRKRSDTKWYAVEVRWDILLRIWRIVLFLRAVVNIPIQTLIIPPWLLLRKMIILQLELGPPVTRWAVQTYSDISAKNFLILITYRRRHSKIILKLYHLLYSVSPRAENIILWIYWA